MNRETGEVRQMRAENLRDHIDHLVEDGVLAHGSWSQCLRLHLMQYDAASSDASDCPRKPGGVALAAIAA